MSLFSLPFSPAVSDWMRFLWLDFHFRFFPGWPQGFTTGWDLPLD